MRISTAVLSLMLGTGFAVTAPSPALAADTKEAKSDKTAANKFFLSYRAQAGQVKKVSSEGTAKFSAGGQDIVMDVKQVSKITFTAIAANGNITITDETESMERTMNGQKMPEEKDEDVTTVTFTPAGEIVAFSEKKKSDEPDEDHLGARLTVASSIVFPAKTVGTGDKWAHDYVARGDIGTRTAHADFELLAFEKVGNTNTAKIKMTYTESGTTPVVFISTQNVDVATGDTVSQSYEVSNIPLGGGMVASATSKDVRTEGAPFAANQTPKPLTEAPKAIAGDGKTEPIAAAAPKVEPKKDKTIDETVKEGFVKTEGVVTLWRKKEAGSDKIYVELPESAFNKLMMLQATAATGTAEQVIAGDPISDLVFQFEKMDDRVFLTVPNFLFRSTKPEMARAVRRSYADGYLQAFKIEAKQESRKSVLIDVSDFFRGDISQVSQLFSGGGSPFGGGAGSGYSLDRDKTFIKEIKNFPENLVVSTQYHFQKGGRAFSGALADARSAPITVIYNLSALPKDTDYKPRLSDPRIGYFTSDYLSFDDDTAKDPMVHYIQRWKLEKKDPTAALSEPVKPIVFWLDNGIPAEYRPAFEKGFLIWNKAFEKIGYKNAVVVKQIPDKPDPKDPNTPTDTADMRFNCVRFSPSNAGYAIALFRTNPLTGQIVNASITMDAAFVIGGNQEYQQVISPGEAFAIGAGIPQEEARYKASLQAKPGQPARTAMANFNDPRYCSRASEGKQSLQFGHQALSAMAANGVLSPAERKAFVDQYVTEVIAHEFGHCIGLRHNFVASKEYSLAQLGDKAVTDAGGTGASVMDYNPFNIAALNKSGAMYFATEIGTYDKWAVEYGYMDIPSAKTPEEEKPVLKRHAAQSGKPGHAYLSDEVADSFDPDIARFDIGKDNLAFQKETMKLARKLLMSLPQREPKNGESYYDFTRDFNLLLRYYSGAAGFATRFIGGQNLSHTNKGDMGEKPAIATVSPNTQRQALSLLTTYLFAPNALPVPPSYYGKLASDASPFAFGADEVAMLDRLSILQKSALTRLFSSTMLKRVANNEFKAAAKEKPFTLPYLFNTVSGSVWAEIPAKSNVDALRRNLQRAYVERMADIALQGGVNADAQMLAWNELRTMKTKLTAAKSVPTLDTYTKAHYADSLDKITRTLDARVTLGQNGGAVNPLDLLSLLFGRPKEMIAEEAAKAAAQNANP
ncbi:MAG: zinc-dependent metalloprotease [Armatimonadetes bacterium]|nr:zinc-dependent metalloprotease [Armatimonadota bacterium]